MEKMKDNIKVAELTQKLNKRNQTIKNKIKNEFPSIPFKLRKYVFFNGKWVQKIDNFPNDPEMELLYKDTMLNLEYLYNKMILSFLNFAFGGEHHSTYLISSSDYVDTISETVLGIYLNQTSGLILDKKRYHLTGEQTEESVLATDWFFIMKNQSNCAKESVSYKRFARIKNFDVPAILRPFIDFDGERFEKDLLFPRILNKKYDEYIGNLKTLLAIKENEFWETMFGFRYTTSCWNKKKKNMDCKND